MTSRIEVKRLRGTTAEINAYTGPEAVITPVTDNWGDVRVHDGVTPGGVPIGGGALTFPLATGLGGTGRSTLTANAVLLGGNSPIGFATIGTANRVLADNGTGADPTFKTITALLDAAFGSAQGDVLYRNASAWVVLSPGTSGQFLKTQGAAANVLWATVTGLSAASDNTVVSNISGGSATPSNNTLTAVLDHVLGATRGMILYRGASAWAALAAGTSGQFLETLGSSADPAWASIPAGSLAAVSDKRLLANISGGSAAPSANTLTAVIDSMIGGADGDILVRVSGSWTNQRPTYRVAFSFTSGVLANSQLLGFHRFDKAATFNSNFGTYLGHASQAGGTANATGSTVINVDKAATATPNTFSNVGTITIAAGTVTPTLATSGSVSFAQGDVMRLQGPATADATFANFFATLVGFET